MNLLAAYISGIVCHGRIFGSPALFPFLALYPSALFYTTLLSTGSYGNSFSLLPILLVYNPSTYYPYMRVQGESEMRNDIVSFTPGTSWSLI